MMQFSALFAFSVGVVLLVIPGVSIAFFALAALLLPAEWRSVAIAYDRIELLARGSRKRKKDARRARDSQEDDDIALRDTLKAEPNVVSSVSSQPASDQRVLWVRPSAAPRAPVAGTTKIWSSDIAIPKTPIQRRPPVQPAAARASKAVVMVPPPVMVTNRPDRAPAADARPTVEIRPPVRA